jgi:hypothetical protein
MQEIVLRGHLSRPALELALHRLSLHFGDQDCGLIIDAISLTGYDAEARHYFVEWNRTHRGELVGVGIVTRNILLRAVISAMGLASGQNMRSFQERPSAEIWLAALRSARRADEA